MVASSSKPYTVYRSVKHSKNKYARPSAGITILATDASKSQWPPITKKKAKSVNTGSGGVTNHYEIASDDEKNLWFKKIGKFLAEEVLNKDEDQEQVDPKLSVLVAFPPGYELFKHKKGENFEWRTDHYLIGSTTVGRFRSPAEFLHHAKWLMEGMPKLPGSRPNSSDEEEDGPSTSRREPHGANACSCKYCDGSVPQRQISMKHTNYHPPPKRRRDADDAGQRPKRKKEEHEIMAKDYRNMDLKSIPKPKTEVKSESEPELLVMSDEEE